MCASVYVCMCRCVCVHMCMYVYVCACMCVYLCVLHVCVHVCMCVCMCVCVHVCVCACVCTGVHVYLKELCSQVWFHLFVLEAFVPQVPEVEPGLFVVPIGGLQYLIQVVLSLRNGADMISMHTLFAFVRHPPPPIMIDGTFLAACK